MKTLFDNCENWEKDPPELWESEWQGMPEFIQEDARPYQSIMLHFETEKDRNDFAKLINQNITYRTKFIYYPELKWEDTSKTICIDEK